jgi:hypothetical protein
MLMDEEALRRVIRQELQGAEERLEKRLDAKLAALEERMDTKLCATEQRLVEKNRVEFEQLAENGRMQFRQLGELYRSTQERLDQIEKHLGAQIAATRGAVEALRASLERQDFRSDEPGRRITTLELREPQ